MSANVPTTVAQAFVESVSRYADRVALITADGASITYGTLGADVARAVSVLRELGCRSGDRIAVWLPNRPEWPILQYAAALLGLLIIPVNARFRANEAEYVLRKSGARVLFCQHSFLTNDYVARLKEIAGGEIGTGDRASLPSLPELERIVMFDADSGAGIASYAALADKVTAADDLPALALQRKPSDELWIFWTSGTTSAPKGAVLDQSAISNVWNWTSLARYTGDDRILATFPLFYIAGAFWCMLAPMLRGGVLVMGQEFTADEILKLCRRDKVTVLAGIPLLLKALVNDPSFDPTAFAHVRLGWFGGATISEDDLKQIKEGIGYEHLLQVYGMTELHGFASSTRPDDPIEVTYRTVGHPLPGFRFRLLRPGTREEVAQGEAGELVVQGPRLVDYEGISEEDRKRFFDDDGWFHTGDLLKRDAAGRYVFTGRVKDLIKIGGENASASEIELVLMTYPNVRNVAVTAVPDADRGEVPAAFIEAVEGTTLDINALREWTRGKVAPFKVPRYWKLLQAEQWPLTSSGKIAKWQLKAG
jgi:fatty-acyl-CoA synthase